MAKADVYLNLQPSEIPSFILRQLQAATRLMATQCRSGSSPAQAFAAAALAVYSLRSSQGSDKPVIEAEISALAKSLNRQRTQAAVAKKTSAGKIVGMPYEGGNYEGPVRNGLPHGRGSLRFMEGAGYEGDFVAGKRHGDGREIYEGGRIYKGAFADGLRDGQGALSGPQESCSGTWQQGDLRKGRGVC